MLVCNKQVFVTTVHLFSDFRLFRYSELTRSSSKDPAWLGCDQVEKALIIKAVFASFTALATAAKLFVRESSFTCAGDCPGSSAVRPTRRQQASLVSVVALCIFQLQLCRVLSEYKHYGALGMILGVVSGEALILAPSVGRLDQMLSQNRMGHA